MGEHGGGTLPFLELYLQPEVKPQASRTIHDAKVPGAI